MIPRTGIAILLIGLWSCTSFSEFIPVAKVGDELIDRPELMSDSLRANVALVLTYYNEDWKMESERLLVSQTDRELLWNYTTKAMDRTWMATHTPTQTKP
jgi:hypothetical protein